MNSGKFELAKGRVKEAVGRLTGKERLTTEGQTDQRNGKTTHDLEEVSERAKGVVNDAADMATVAIDKTRDVLHQR
jgi:uncharacterized protein YjbJ (UPF0337 family)